MDFCNELENKKTLRKNENFHAKSVFNKIEFALFTNNLKTLLVNRGDLKLLCILQFNFTQ